MPRLLIVDDDAQLLRSLSITLRAFNYHVLTSTNGLDALNSATRNQLDLVILDLGLPDMDGTTVIRGLRGWTTVPILVLSGRDDPAAKTHALDLGADDYITKPFSMDELHARIRAALRRSATQTEPALPQPQRIGDWLIDLAAHTITRAPTAFTVNGPGDTPPATAAGSRTDTHSIVAAAATEATPSAPHLTPTEWRLLEILLANPGKLVVSRQLLTEVWGNGHEQATNYLRLYIWQLRAKLERDPSQPQHLTTDVGMGYRYQP
jgi:two-component system, OmpR family, KDP operon response regulator KdpE